MKKLLLGFVLFLAALLPLGAHAAPIAPAPGDTHPFVYLSDDFIAGLYNEDGTVKDAYAKSYASIKKAASYAMQALPDDGALSSGISNRLVTRALMYALGEYDYDHARTTIEYTLKYLKKPITSKTYSIDMYKDIGTNGIQCGALVYDWCYDAMTPDERTTLAKYILEMYKDTNGDGSPNYTQPCQITNPGSWTDIAGKAVGQPLIYNCIAVTALYDLYPDIYNNVMDKVQGTMAKALKLYGSAGALSDGSIAYTRDYYSYHIYILLQRLGASDKKLEAFYGDQQALGYKMLYSRVPYGAMIRQGDGFSKDSYKVGVFSNGTEQTDLGLLASMYDNPYFRFNYYKENSGAQGVIGFLTMDCDTELKFHDELPLAYETKKPRTEIMARTSWQDGVNSPAAYAYMNMNERRTGDHDHGDIGSFQIYYKGPLTMPGGIYAGTDWGQLHWRNYYTRTIAANCMTVYDPNEKFPWSNINLEANDGGQKVVKNWVISNVASHISEDTNIWAVTEGTYIGPNKQTPAFSYVKGDLTPAYSENKMESYKRGMVFMDTFNQTYPGVMIVFDRVVSTDASFKKRWLLQSVNDADVSGNKITITNTEGDANGKLVNTTLMPESVEIEKVGGRGVYISDGKEWPAPVDVTGYLDSYASGFRLEVSPKYENTEDIFLNAMYVTDADGNAPALPMIKEVTDEFVGVTTLDRMVMFAKDGNFVENEFTITVRDNNKGGEMLCLITDITPGKWTISGNDTSITLESLKDDNCLTFAVNPGTYTITPANSNAAVTSLTWEEMPKEKFGDFVVKLDTCYMYVPDETYYHNDIPYLSAETCENLGKSISVETNGDTVTVNRGGNISVIKVGEDSYKYNDKNIDVENSAILHDGKVYLPVLEFCSAFAIDGSMSPETRVLKISSGKNVDTTNYIKATEISGIENAFVLSDGVIGESVNVPAEYVITYNMGDEVKKIERIDFAASSLTGAKVWYSVDGKNYYYIPNTLKAASENVIPCIPDGDYYARYIRIALPNTTAVRELAVYGTTPEKKSFFVEDKVNVADTNVNFEAQVYIAEEFKSAEIYFGDKKIYNIPKSSDNVYNISIPAENLADLYGTNELSLRVDFGSEYETDVREITFTQGRKSVQLVNLTFEETSLSKVFKTYTSSASKFDLGRNLQGSSSATEELGDGKYKMTLKAPAMAAPFLLVNYMKKYDAASRTYLPINDGIFTAKFDMYISSESLTLTLEPRTKDVNTSSNTTIIYPATGPSYSLFRGISGLYEFTLEFDTVNSLLRFYSREIDEVTGERAEFRKLEKEIYFECNGLGQIRFTFTNPSAEVEGYWTLDNYTVDYRELAFDDIAFYKASNDLFANVNTKVFGGEKVKVFAAVKKDGLLCNFKVYSPSDESAFCTAEFDVPSDFFTAEGYQAELYIVSADNLLNVLSKTIYEK